MSNLNNNTTQLELLLAKVNALPEAGGGTDTSDATATADKIFEGETAYGANGKVTGTFTIDSELSTQEDLISQISTLVAQKANPSGGVELPDLTNPAIAADILSGKEAIDENGNKITGTIATKTSSNLTSSGATVTVPAGYYASNATKSVTSGSAKTPATTVTKNPSISINSSGLITASVSGTQNVTPTVTAGYVSSGTAGTITVSGSATKQLTTKGSTTYTPSTSNQTIASGTYLTGTQTIKGDANLVADNIKSGVSIFGVAGSYEGSGGGSGGGGTSVEMCTGTINVNAPNMTNFTVYALNQNLQVETITLGAMSGGTFPVAKGTIVAVTPWSSMGQTSGGCTICFGVMAGGAFVVSDDFTLIYQ